MFSFNINLQKKLVVTKQYLSCSATAEAQMNFHLHQITIKSNSLDNFIYLQVISEVKV